MHVQLSSIRDIVLSTSTISVIEHAEIYHQPLQHVTTVTTITLQDD